MERNAHYTLVGLFTLILTVGVCAFLIWLAGAQFIRRFDTYDIAFQGPVRGLSTGGAVFLSGIHVGEVTHLALDKEDPNRVTASIRIASDTPVRTSSRASLEPQGVTGASYVQITAGNRHSAMLKDTVPRGVIPVIQSTRSPLESLLEGGGDVLSRTVEALDRLNRVLSDRNIADLTATISDIHVATAGFKGAGRMVSDIGRASREVALASAQVGVLADRSTRLVDGDGKRSLAAITATATELQGAAQDVRTLTSGLVGPTNSFARDGLPQLQRTLQSVQGTSDELSRLMADFQSSPTGLIARPPALTAEIKP
jgi:phospholipid/cholesterol/gamma-HCH transport system substrate-binding protein